MNVFITIVSWLVIIPRRWANGDWSTLLGVYLQLDNMAIHLYPLIFTSINLFLLSDMIVYLQDIWIVPVTSISYLVFAFSYTSYTGSFIYNFLTFEDNLTWILAVSGTAGSLLVHCLNALLTQWMRGRWEKDYLWWN